MSQENVDTVLAFHAAYNAREIDAAVDFCAADVDVFPDASIFPEAASFVGPEKLRGLLEETWSAWASSGVTPNEVLDMEDSRVLVRADWGGTGTGSGVEASTNLSAIYTVREGEIARIEWFFDHAKALRAAGLAE
jgi:ketosteroid isomerase-like protein